MAVLSDNTDQSYLEHLEDEFQNLKNLIFKYDEAISALLTGTHQSYQLDTGQTMQRVTRLNLAELYSTRKQLMSELSTLAVRLRKTPGQKQGIPFW